MRLFSDYMIEVIVISRYNEVFEVVIGWGLFNFDNSTSSPELFALGCKFNSFIFYCGQARKNAHISSIAPCNETNTYWQFVGG